MSTTPAQATVSMMNLRSHPGTVVDKVFYGNESFVIERSGQPRAVLVSVRDFEEMKRLKQIAKKRLFSLVDTVKSRTSKHDSNQLQKAIDEAAEVARSAVG